VEACTYQMGEKLSQVSALGRGTPGTVMAGSLSFLSVSPLIRYRLTI
jgi:hypothetical protein